jgi:Uma2 family endonuclease
MNSFGPRYRETTQAAEGLPRLRWRVADLDRLMQAGVIGEDDRIELLGGEFVPMSAKGSLHEDIRSALHAWFRRNLPDDVEYSSELGWRPDEYTYCEPDFALHQHVKSPSRMPASNVYLLIEIADTSEKKDLDVKSALYARLGVQEYWIIRANTLETRVHRQPGPTGYADVSERSASDRLQCALVPAVNIRLTDFEIS